MMSPSPTRKSASSSTTSSTSSSSNQQRPAFLLSEPSSPPDPSKSQCSSLDGESFECFGENDMISSSTLEAHLNNSNANGVDLELVAPHLQHEPPDRNNMLRHTWARTSLRGLRSSAGKRHLGSNALANHLYRSSSFNSSGRSSNCGETDEMFSDVSLEDVQDLNHKLELLQRQVTNLADVDDRTSRAKTDYAVLQAKYHMLEEQLRETELRSEERLLEEQKRCRELLARVERENSLKNENCQIKIQTVESETSGLRDEIQRLRMQCDKQAADLHLSEEKLENTRYNLSRCQEQYSEAKANEKRYLHEKTSAEHMIMELDKEVEKMRTERAILKSTAKSHFVSASSLSLESTNSSEPFRIEELQHEVDDLKKRNKYLEESNEELQAMLLTSRIEEGRNLLNGGTSTINLADELKEMGQCQDSVDSATMNSLSQLQIAYQDKEEEVRRLKRYIDSIILNIVENHPQLLEIKSSTSF